MPLSRRARPGLACPGDRPLRGATGHAGRRRAPAHPRRPQSREPAPAAARRRLALRRVSRLRAGPRARSADRSRAPGGLDAARVPRDARALPPRLRARRRRPRGRARRDLRGLPAARGDRVVPPERAPRARALLPRAPDRLARRATPAVGVRFPVGRATRRLAIALIFLAPSLALFAAFVFV